MSEPVGTVRSAGFRLLIDGWSRGEPMLEVVSDGEGRYTVTSDNIIPRNEQSETPRALSSEDGHEVIGLVTSFLCSLDSREYLRRRVDEHKQA